MPFRWWVTTFFVSFSFPSVLHNLTKLMSKLEAAQNSLSVSTVLPRISFAPCPSWKFLLRLLAFATSSTLLIHFKESVSACSIYRRSFITISLFPFFLFFFSGLAGDCCCVFGDGAAWRGNKPNWDLAALPARFAWRSTAKKTYPGQKNPASYAGHHFSPFFSIFFPFLLYSDDRKLQQIC